LERILKDADRTDNAKLHIIFIDKNHPLNAIETVVRIIDENMPRSVDYRKVFLIPKIDPQARIGGLPLSASFMA
jgi:hypothetical protein